MVAGTHDGTFRMTRAGRRGRLGQRSVRRDHHDRRDDTPRRHHHLRPPGPQPDEGLRGRTRWGPGALRGGFALRLADPGRCRPQRAGPPLRHVGARIGPDRRPATAAAAVGHRPGRRRRVRGPTGQPTGRRSGRGAPRRATDAPTAFPTDGRRPLRCHRDPGDPAALRPPGEVTPEMQFVATREGVPAELVRDEIAAGPGHPPLQRQPPRVRADDHRLEVPGEGQRQHRQLGRDLVDRGGGPEADLGHPLGRRHGHGPVDRDRTSTRPASGSCATRRCPSAPCRSTRPWRRSTAPPRN